jgi:hypothetical protein
LELHFLRLCKESVLVHLRALNTRISTPDLGGRRLLRAIQNGQPNFFDTFFQMLTKLFCIVLYAIFVLDLKIVKWEIKLKKTN